WLAVILTSACFALLHPDWSWGIIFLLALCLGYAYERTGILWVSIFMHAAFNGLEVALDWVTNHPH
ncbi:MAG TPA: CPBP family intramembrane glutamic endopeptidase, partial [Tepidisphaeraceae bacterium]|nr:CPBP family intramembrane glutamic endopeptidase [Tepidisphaeraceae bacterium]